MGKRRQERVGRLLKMHANQREEIDEVRAGDIAAIVGLKDVTTGETLSPRRTTPSSWSPWTSPTPVISVAIEPKTKADQEKLSASLMKLTKEDPTFRLRVDEETGQTLISGMGELHLEIIVDRLTREFGVQASVGKPQVAYRETITKEAQAEGKYIKQTGGHGQYGHVKIRVAPLGEGDNIVFENDITGGVIPQEFIGPVEKGIREAAELGVLAGLPHEGREGHPLRRVLPRGGLLRDGLQDRRLHGLQGGRGQGGPGPPRARHEGGGDGPRKLHGRRHRRHQLPPRQDPRHGVARRTSRSSRPCVPLSEMFGYATSLRSLTQGRGNYVMQFDRYETVPKSGVGRDRRPRAGPLVKEAEDVEGEIQPD